MTAAVYARLRVADPGRWRALALSWRRWATQAGRLAADLTTDLVRLGAAWSGAAASAAAARVTALHRRLVVFRVLCWQVDQAAAAFAAALTRARHLLSRALSAAHRAGLTIDDEGTVRAAGPRPFALPLPNDAAGHPASATPGAYGSLALPATSSTPGMPSSFSTPGAPSTSTPGVPSTSMPGARSAFSTPGAPSTFSTPGAPSVFSTPGVPTGFPAPGSPAAHADAVRRAAASAVAADLAAAVAVAARADEAAAERLTQIEASAEVLTRIEAARVPAGSAGPAGVSMPSCGASPAEVRRWWAGLDPGERLWLLATEPAWLAPLDGIPAADRDAANRLLLDERRAEVDRALAAAGRGERERLRAVRRGLDALADRLAGDEGERAYLLRLDPSEEGRVVLALGDPDRADNVVTHVPGMTADLASFGGELTRAERVAGRATELGPAAATSAVLWLDYDAPDFVDEAASARQAEAGAPALRHFQEGLRATHDGPTARQTVIGHSYGSLVVGKAAAVAGLPADNVVFVGSPGVGVDSAARLAVPPGHVWSTTSSSDIIQYAAVAPSSLIRDVQLAGPLPVVGPLLAFGHPERDLWFGHNPSDPSFGAHLFPSDPHAGHLGYWDKGSPSLDALAAITLGTAQ